MKTVGIIKENFLMTKNMAKAFTDMQMESNIMEAGSKANNMVKVNLQI